MRTGILGGTFDPIHNGHILIAQMALEHLELDRVILLPSGTPPHKAHPTPKEERLRMTELACEEHACFITSDMEVMRSGTTYTVDSLEQLKADYPEDDLFYIIGEDTLSVLDSWYCLERAAGKCVFAVFGRNGFGVEADAEQKLIEKFGIDIVRMPFSGPDISSTQIRKLTAENKQIDSVVPTKVAEYIHNNGLYIANMTERDILADLMERLKPTRFSHTLGVAETATRMAERFGADPIRTRYAAILHDCAKYADIAEMKELISTAGIETDTQELDSENVLHAPAGAVLAEKRYGVLDPEILSAIRKHTIGDAYMSRMDAIIYTADFIEPGRKSFPGLDEVRNLAKTDLYKAMIGCAELTNAYLIQQGVLPHYKSIEMIKHYKNKES